MPPVTNGKNVKGKGIKRFFKFLGLGAVVAASAYFIFSGSPTAITTTPVSYSELLNNIEDIESVNIESLTTEGNYQVIATLEDGNELVTELISANQLDNLEVLAEEHDVDITNVVATEENGAGTIIMWVAIVSVVGLVFWGVSRIIRDTYEGITSVVSNGGAGGAGKGGSNPNDMTKSKAQLVQDTHISLDQVAGIDDEKEDILEVIDMIKNADKYIKAGAEIPKGIMLSGAPGCGKTMLAKAIAHEAGVPFYSVSGSDFVEMYVGVGAARIRDTFAEARKHKEGAIIFFDEIDAVAKKRGSGPGSNDEREATLNALLTELDGFKSLTDKIFVIGATNRVELLDPALLRPGRFERKIIVPTPDQHGREQILAVYAKNKPLAEGISLETVAKLASGFSGAELKALMNEAVLMMLRNREEVITLEHISESIDRVMMGPAKKSHKYSEHEKRLVATHEAGHAVVGLRLKNADEVVKITVIPRGDAGGYCMSTPKEERFVQTAAEIRERICGLLGGRIAEELVYGSTTTGAHNDLEKATALARALVMDYGLSSLGVAQLRKRTGGEAYDHNISERTKERIDDEINKIIGMCYEETRDLIKANMELLNLIADTLVEQETINKDEIKGIVNRIDGVEEETEEVAIAAVECQPSFIKDEE